MENQEGGISVDAENPEAPVPASEPDRNPIYTFLSRGGAASNTSSYEDDLRADVCAKVSVLGLGVGAFLLVVLLPLSFGNVEYYEFAFKKSKNTGKVDLRQVYQSGHYLVGPSTTMKKFPADAQVVEIANVSFLTSENLQMSVSVSFAFFLIEDELVDLHEKLDLKFQEPIRNRAQDPLKGTGPLFRTEQYFSSRPEIEAALGAAVAARLRELHVDVRHFQLGAVTVPPEVKSRQLDNAIQVENNALAELVKEAELIREETRTLVNRINNNSTLVTKTAIANANLLATNARTTANEIVSTARSMGLRDTYEALGIVDGKQKASLDYIRTLGRHAEARFSIVDNKMPLILNQAQG